MNCDSYMIVYWNTYAGYSKFVRHLFKFRFVNSKFRIRKKVSYKYKLYITYKLTTVHVLKPREVQFLF